MTVKDILIKWLEQLGYDGLFNTNGNCSCRLDDLVPCSENCSQCIPGYLMPDPSGEFNYIITAHYKSEKPLGDQETDT